MSVRERDRTWAIERVRVGGQRREGRKNKEKRKERAKGGEKSHFSLCSLRVSHCSSEEAEQFAISLGSPCNPHQFPTLFVYAQQETYPPGWATVWITSSFKDWILVLSLICSPAWNNISLPLCCFDLVKWSNIGNLWWDRSKAIYYCNVFVH